MKTVKVAAAALNQTPLAWDGNLSNIVEAISEARGQGVGILCLPELCISGYGCEDMFLSKSVVDAAVVALLQIAPHTEGIVVSAGLPILFQNAVFNAACLLVDGRVAGFVAKQNLAGEGLHYEPRWFKPWPAGLRSRIRVGDDEYPIGDLYFECGGIGIGFEICEDAWVAKRPGGDLSLKGVDIILNPSASHFAFGKSKVRRQFVIEGSRAFGVTYVYANLLGNEAGRIIYDGDALIASAGNLIAEGTRFSFADSIVTTALIDIDQTRMTKARTGSFRPQLDAGEEGRVECEFSWPAGNDLPSKPIEPENVSKEEEFTRAVCLGLFDYLRKSKSDGFVVSLSGGADSSAVATLIAQMVSIGVTELGVDSFLSKLGRDTSSEVAEETGITRSLLTCAYQGTRNSSDETRNAARELASALNATYTEFEIDRIVDDYTELAAEALGRPLNWENDDIALQNIQARSRAPSVWMLANLKNALLVSTSNRSEAAVGYATMDGDTSGGLSPIAGIDKAFLKDWLAWMADTGPEGGEPVPALKHVISLQPTAELRPPSEGQTDEEDLMPYRLLDAIERAAIRDKRSPVEIFKLMRDQFEEYSAEDLGNWIDRFFRLWCRNQWKRERYAPSFHLDDENLDPKTWCRFPILSGGFEKELSDLRKLVNETASD
ncbi:MAG: NAD(+) synthase [Planctomycetota bacterium]|nr:NAD(+) synthase [Planctomycetota bacterium]MDP7248452.1 NAD(+) synthase [Planctomycetota bacterium]